MPNSKATAWAEGMALLAKAYHRLERLRQCCDALTPCWVIWPRFHRARPSRPVRWAHEDPGELRADRRRMRVQLK
jgi:hypothetical protein